MIGLLLFVLLLFVAVAWATSLLIGTLARPAAGLLARIEPAARARTWFTAALAPGIVGASVVFGALVPREWLGEMNHCLEHVHMHLCALCGAPSPNVVATTLLIAVITWLAWGLSRGVRRAMQGVRLVGSLLTHREHGVQVIDDARLTAFTAGLLNPQIYLSAPVAASAHRWRAVVAHERAHAKRHDPLLRLIARLASGLHLPATADRVLRELDEAQELAADEDAAAELGDRGLVAATLVEWVKEARLSVQDTLAFEGATLERRVRVLLDPPVYLRTRLAGSFAFNAAFAGLIALATTPLHHSLEHLLELFAG